MALKVFKLTTPNMYLLLDGNNFKVVNKTQISDTITGAVAKEFAQFLQKDADILAIIAKLKKGMILESLDRTAVFNVVGEGYDGTNFMNIAVCVNTPAMSSWTGMIMRDEGIIELPTGCIHEIWNYISTNTTNKPAEETHAATSNKYYIVKSVEELPDTPNRTDIAYLLLKAAEGRPSGSMWRWNGRKWTSLTDGIPDDPDPVEPTPDEPGTGEEPGGNEEPNPDDPGTGEEPNPDEPGGDNPENPENPDSPNPEDPGTGEEPGGDEPNPDEPEEPTPSEPDPLVANTYPDSEEKDDAPQTIGGNDVDVCEVIDNNITDATNITATELASVVNCSMGDGRIVITVA